MNWKTLKVLHPEAFSQWRVLVWQLAEKDHFFQSRGKGKVPWLVVNRGDYCETAYEFVLGEWREVK